MSKLFLGFICALSGFLHCHAQDDKYLEYGAGIGGSIYQGDISPNVLGTLKKPGLSVQLFGNYKLSPAFSVRLHFAYASLHDEDKNYTGARSIRNFTFETNVNEFSAHLVFNPLRNNGEEDYNTLVPYVFTGPGIAMLRINRDWSNFQYGYPEWQKWVLPGLAADSLYRLPKYTLTLPVGLGLRYVIEDNVALFAEISHRFTNEEYLDGFSKAANQRKKDAFSTITIGLVFRRWSDYTSRPIRYY